MDNCDKQNRSFAWWCSNNAVDARRADRLVEIGRSDDAARVSSPLDGQKVYWRAIVGTQVRRLRAMLALTQEEFGNLVGLSGNAVGDIERGRTGLNLDTLCRIAERTGISPQWFLEDDPASPAWDNGKDPRRAYPIHAPWEYRANHTQR